jgi:hypothetical protein
MPPRTRSLKSLSDSARYESLAAPPSLLPANKYCDLTGLPAKYTHPATGVRYNQHTAILASNIDTLHALLDIRGVKRIIK